VSVAVVTGSRGGIGGATVGAFEAAGFDVHGVDRGDDFPALAQLDALVCAHGISGRRLGDGPVETCTEEGWDASVLALVGGDEDFATHAYAASKAGVIGLVRAMAVTYAKDRIRCNVVAPGLVATPMSRRAQNDPRIRARLGELQPLTGDFGTPDDVAAACLYLATAPFVTGAVLTVDGGWTAR